MKIIRRAEGVNRMCESTVRSNLERAAAMVAEAEAMADEFTRNPRPGEYEEVMEAVDPITDKLEEAQSLLLETDIEELPEQQAEEEEGEPDIEDEVHAMAMEKQEIEYRSRMVEADLYRGAADLVGEPLTEGRRPSDQQDELLSAAAVALEAAFGSRQDPGGLLRLAEIRLLQLEVKKARRVCEVVMKMDPDGEHGRRAEELDERILSDPELKDRGKCFIATAACGASDSPEVLELRRFRDSVLMKSGAGRLLVRSYYRCSPPVARLLASSEPACRVVRICVVGPAAKLVSFRCH